MAQKPASPTPFAPSFASSVSASATKKITESQISKDQDTSNQEEDEYETPPESPKSSIGHQLSPPTPLNNNNQSKSEKNSKKSAPKTFTKEELEEIFNKLDKNSDGSLDGSGKGTLTIVKGDAELSENRLIVASAGTVDYVHGEIILNTINFTSTERANNIIEIQAFPQSNDVIGLKDLYLSFAIGDSEINMIKDTITSGEQISGVGYKVTSSYSNGVLTRG